ncbi:MAG: hypothetical protein E6K70_02385 [Planctomycetota bacterium]|nr:MAG: hypothetical protein E6K70_02385 [Planctomycetota bacterium]
MGARTLGMLIACLYMVALLAIWVDQGSRTTFALEPDGRSSADAGDHFQIALETALAALKHDSTAKESITEGVISGRLTLLEGAARFLALHAQRPANSYCAPQTGLFPGGSEGERLCWEIIQWVEMDLREDPRRDRVVGRLVMELHEILARHGTVRLPEDAPVLLRHRQDP